MPRESGFLGWGDDRTSEEAYDEGARESSNAGIGDDLGRSIASTLESVASTISGGDGRTDNERAYDKGWDDGKDNR